MSDQLSGESHPAEPGEEENSRRLFLQSMGKWSGAAIMAAVSGAWLASAPEARAGGAWVNRRGGGGAGWVNRGGGGGAWINGAGGWINRRSGGGGSWVNRW